MVYNTNFNKSYQYHLYDGVYRELFEKKSKPTQYVISISLPIFYISNLSLYSENKLNLRRGWEFSLKQRWSR